MTSPQPGAGERIGIQEASVRLGLSASFLNWALDSGLLKGHRDKSGDWKLDLGELDQAAAVLHREAPVMSKAAENATRQVPAPEPEWPAGDVASRKPPPPAAIPEIPSRAPEPPTSASPAPVSSTVPESGTRSKMDAVYEDQIQYLRRQLTNREGAIGDKDSLILQLTDRIGKLAETAIGRLAVPNLQVPDSGPESKPSAPNLPAPEITAYQQAINDRQDEALTNIRETLLMVRNYLAQLAPDDNE